MADKIAPQATGTDQSDGRPAAPQYRPRQHQAKRARAWWGLACDLLQRAEERITKSFRVPPNGG